MSGTTERPPRSPRAVSAPGSRPETEPRARVLAVAAYLVLLVGWSSLVGIPNDPVGVFLWIWGAFVAWDVQAPREHHLRFPRDWWPVLLGLVVYWFTRGLVDELGLPVHVQMPIDVDTWLAGLVGWESTPTEVLQQAWCGGPCTRDLPPRWWDTALTTVYASHFLVGLTLAAVLWVRDRVAWWAWMRRYLAINYAALVVYLAYPMAPPWMASRDGSMGEVERITSRGWAGTGLDRANIGLPEPEAIRPDLMAFADEVGDIEAIQTGGDLEGLRAEYLVVSGDLEISGEQIYAEIADQLVIISISAARAEDAAEIADLVEQTLGSA